MLNKVMNIITFILVSVCIVLIGVITFPMYIIALESMSFGLLTVLTVLYGGIIVLYIVYAYFMIEECKG